MAIKRDKRIAQDKGATAPIDRLLDGPVAIDAMGFLKNEVPLFQAYAAFDQEPHFDGFHGKQGHSRAANLYDASIAFEQQEFTAGCVGQMENAADAARFLINVADFAWGARSDLDLNLSWIEAGRPEDICIEAIE